MMNRLITLLTDFGLEDGYVGIMKGVIAQINPQATVIDISHGIPPQNILAGQFCLSNAYPYFPTETVHLAVVDPGVGSQRRGIAVQLTRGYYIGPDNGLISGILGLDRAIAAVCLTNRLYWRVPNASFTFHGRDIFAPVAAYLAKGIELEQLGDWISVDSLVSFSLDKIEQRKTEVLGIIQYSDRFGNLITNIPENILKGKSWTVKINNSISISQGETYQGVMLGELVALIGSHGWLEIAVNGGNAQKKLGVNIGNQILVSFVE